ncbi:MAG TPA: efflux RND transporter periplasmic adaptor subunit [Candidatus Binatia bacterium]|nr:efflux RND transporter periplasmic adaptor subunit [Candidatus Binatia bacterium]
MNDSPKPHSSLVPRRPEVERGEGVLRYVVVAALSLAIGVTGTWFALRLQPGPASKSRVATHAQEGTPHEGATGVATAGAGGHSQDAVYISPARQQLIGVRTASVARRELGTSIRTVGTLAYDETRVTHVHTKIAGWVEKLFVDYVGKSVRTGEPLLTVYSPQLVSTQNEHLLALKGSRQPVDPRFPEPRSAIESLLASSRERLKLWDISQAQIDALERTGRVQRTLTLYAPSNGVVLERNVFAGQYVTPDMSMLKIADLSTVWAIGAVFEYESSLIKLGQDVEIDFPYGQAPRPLHGKITFIYPEVDPQTRRVRIRAEFRNPGLEFKPESYVTLVLSSEARSELAIPKEAVVDTGVKQYAILALPDGYFEPREIEVGQPVGEFYPVLKGLGERDTVVTSALFLIDSETNLQTAMQAMSMSMPGMNMGGDKSMPGMDMSGRAEGGAKPPTEQSAPAPAEQSAPDAKPNVNEDPHAGHRGGHSP